MPELNPSRHLDDMEIENILSSEAAQAEFDIRYQNEPSVIDIGPRRYRFEDESRKELEECFVLGLNYGLRKEPLGTTNQSGNPYERRFEVHGHTWGSQYVAGQD